MALKPGLQTHNPGIDNLRGPWGLAPQPHSLAPARRRLSFWKAPGGGMQAGSPVLPGGAPVVGLRAVHTKPPFSSPTALPPGSWMARPTFSMKVFPSLLGLLLPAKPLCPPLPGCLCLYKHLNPPGLGAEGQRTSNPPHPTPPACTPRGPCLPPPTLYAHDWLAFGGSRDESGQACLETPALLLAAQVPEERNSMPSSPQRPAKGQ